MIAVIQRVSKAGISVGGQQIAEIDSGLVILLGIMSDDDETDCQFLRDKITHFRIFNDENDKMNLSIQDINGEALVVSQFTLCGDWQKGRRPSFINAASPERGKKLYNLFIEYMESENIPIKTGHFGAMMEVSLINDGPVTFVLDSKMKKVK
ncbi:MAG: D-tyrosyl-tRNA(Tyr) deacylase [Candidatus Marinimicrobia bacterium]|jgi:D-tyrosyl-tRNA(Tyr) deacylase|nr:D-tyrosyl-tRNA(Tyr) deacylase [Candidatus Neomarinimicrobiota bacterium]